MPPGRQLGDAALMSGVGTGERSLGLVAGVVCAVAVLAVCGAGGFLFGQQRAERARRGWTLVPVVTAARDLPAGTVVKPGDFVESTAPEQFVTAQIHDLEGGVEHGRTWSRSGAWNEEGRTLLAPIAKGELVHFGHLSPVVVRISRACMEQTAATAASLGLASDDAVRALMTDLQKKSGW